MNDHQQRFAALQGVGMQQQRQNNVAPVVIYDSQRNAMLGWVDPTSGNEVAPYDIGQAIEYIDFQTNRHIGWFDIHTGQQTNDPTQVVRSPLQIQPPLGRQQQTPLVTPNVPRPAVVSPMGTAPGTVTRSFKQKGTQVMAPAPQQPLVEQAVVQSPVQSANKPPQPQPALEEETQAVFTSGVAIPYIKLVLANNSDTASKDVVKSDALTLPDNTYTTALDKALNQKGDNAVALLAFQELTFHRPGGVDDSKVMQFTGLTMATLGEELDSYRTDENHYEDLDVSGPLLRYTTREVNRVLATHPDKPRLDDLVKDAGGMIQWLRGDTGTTDILTDMRLFNKAVVREEYGSGLELTTKKKHMSVYDTFTYYTPVVLVSVKSDVLSEALDGTPDDTNVLITGNNAGGLVGLLQDAVDLTEGITHMVLLHIDGRAYRATYVEDTNDWYITKHVR